MKYANQRNFTVNREIPTKNTREAYLTIYCRNLIAAARDLNGNTFKLYCYIASNRNGYSFDFSPQDFINQYGVSINSARSSVQELITKGYLVETKHNFYQFYEVPIAAPTPSSNNAKTEEAASTQPASDTKSTICENPAAPARPAPTEKRIFTHKVTGEKRTFTYQEVLERSNFNEVTALERWRKGSPIDDFEF